jgi:diadenosine tetraphosphate (Ap4A) HIT family hydrolase
MQRGEGCPMCTPSEDELGPFGIRVYEGRWSNAYLARHPVRPGYAYVIWKGRHVTEPTELSAKEAAGFWAEVARVAAAVEERSRPVKMNWLHLGNGVPHLHVHLVPRPRDDPSAGGPLEAVAFDQAATPALSDEELRVGGDALRALLR